MALLRDWLRDEAPTGSGSFVMATGIVSLSMGLSGHSMIEDVLFAACTAGWFVLATVFVYRLVAHSRTWWLETTELGAWTAVAGTTVFASALDAVLGWRPRC